MKSNGNCFVLVADGFNENSVRQTAEFFLTNDVNLTFLSLYRSPVINKLAAKFAANSVSSLLLGDVLQQELPDGLLIAGGAICGQHLMIDPRVYHLIEQLSYAERPIGLLYPTYVPLVESMNRVAGNLPLLFQEKRYPEAFFHHFVREMMQAGAFYLQQASPFIL
ncbi:MAG: hypothetical protein R3D55_09190 [Chloroflexota bacterium]